MFFLQLKPHKAACRAILIYSGLLSLSVALFHLTAGYPSPSMAGCPPGQPSPIVWCMTGPEYAAAATKADSPQQNSASRKQCCIQVCVCTCAQFCYCENTHRTKRRINPAVRSWKKKSVGLVSWLFRIWQNIKSDKQLPEKSAWGKIRLSEAPVQLSCRVFLFREEKKESGKSLSHMWHL